MAEQGTPGWRAWTAGAAFVALLIGGLLIVRTENEPVPPTPPPTPEHVVATRPIVPQPPQPLGRAELIDTVAQAADDYAAGKPRNIQLLAGRRVALSLPFGCQGPAEDLSKVQSGWTYDAETGALRVKVEPQDWTDAPFIAATAGRTTIEAAEGFWIERPWTAAESCPPRATASAEPSTTRETLALVQLFEPGTKRADRRSGRAYQAVETVAPGEIALDQGLRLRIEGRLAGLGDGPPIGCWSDSPNLRPICTVRVRFDRIAITDASGTRTLADWTY
jgi:hypothetical protein